MTMIEIVPIKGRDIAIVNSDDVLIKDVETAENLMDVILRQAETNYFCINSEAVHNDYFRLKTKLAPKIIKKFEENNVKFAVFGDISKFTDNNIPFQKFVNETNTSYNTAFFCGDQEDAVATLSKI